MKDQGLTIKDIPILLAMSKKLLLSGFIAPLNARKLVRQCRLVAESYPESYDKFDALDATKEFSYWLHEYLNTKKA